MGDKEKKKEPADKRSNNKDDQEDKEPARSRSCDSQSSCYTGSYVSWSSYDSESSGRSRAINGNGHRHPKRKQTRRPKKEKARNGRVTKPSRRTQKQTCRQKKKQTRKLARAAHNDPGKTISISTIMSKVSTKSSVSVCSNDLCHQKVKPSKSVRLTKEVRKNCVAEILKRMKATRKRSVMKMAVDDNDGDQKIEIIDVDEDEDSENNYGASEKDRGGEDGFVKDTNE